MVDSNHRSTVIVFMLSDWGHADLLERGGHFGGAGLDRPEAEPWHHKREQAGGYGHGV